MPSPRITVAVPSYQQGRYLDDALTSLFRQEGVDVEVFLADAGSTDETSAVIARWAHRLAGWRSHPDTGQAAAINEAIAQGIAPYVTWLNSDDWLLDDGLKMLVAALESNPDASVAYGRCWNVDERSGRRSPVWVEPFDQNRMALRNVIAQPAALMRRSAWQEVGGVDPQLQMTMDYDLWWRMYREAGPLLFVDRFVAVNRVHADTKTATQRRRHYAEAIATVRRHHGRVPLKWWLAQPFAVWYRALTANLRRTRRPVNERRAARRT